MQNRGDALCAPVREQALHIALTLGGALDEDRFIANRLLLGMDRRHIFAHGFAADLHVPHRVVAVGLGVAFPNVHGVGHEFAHGGLEVVIADDPAGNARSARADAGFVENDNVAPITLAGRFELQRQVVGGAEPVNPGTNDDVGAARRNGHQITSPM